MNKFGKYRSVDNRYWAVPIKYCPEIENSKTYSYETSNYDTDSLMEAIRSGRNLSNYSFKKLCKEKKLDFVIMDSMGKNLVCAWRNNKTCRVGMPFLCRKTTRNGKLGMAGYFKYCIWKKQEN